MLAATMKTRNRTNVNSIKLKSSTVDAGTLFVECEKATTSKGGGLGGRGRGGIGIGKVRGLDVTRLLTGLRDGRLVGVFLPAR